MNHRQPPRSPAGMRRALQSLSLLMLPTIACASNLNGHRRYGPPQPCPVHLPDPYLPRIGAPSLRFQPEMVVASSPLPPLNPKETPTTTSPDALTAATNAASVVPVAPVASPTEASTDETKSTSPAGSAGGKIRLPAPILPDDVQQVVHPEDFLPYFQFPAPGGSGARVIVPVAPAAAPTPAQQPPSSATYIQTP